MQPLSPSQREILTEAVATYETDRLLSGELEAYLAARGIDEETASGFRLGSCDSPLPGHERFKGMLAIPYLDKNDEPLSIRFRCIKDHNHRDSYHGKYNSETGDVPRMFNVRAVHRAAGEAIHVTEGELDAVILSKLGLDAVAIPGTNSWRAHHRRMLAGFSRVWVWADRDQAPKRGQDDTPPGDRLLNKILSAMRQAKAVRLPELGDVSDHYLKHGGDALLELIKEKK